MNRASMMFLLLMCVFLATPGTAEILIRIPFGPASGNAVSGRISPDEGVPPLPGPVAMAPLPDGGLIVLDAGYHRFFEIAPDGTWTRTLPIPTPSRGAPRWKDFTFAGSQGFYLLDGTDNRVFSWDGGTQPPQLLQEIPDHPTVLRLFPGPDDTFTALAVGDGARLLRLTPQGVPVSEVADGPLAKALDCRGVAGFRIAVSPEEAEITPLLFEPRFPEESNPSIAGPLTWKKVHADRQLQSVEVIGSDQTGTLFLVGTESGGQGQGEATYLAAVDALGKTVSRIDLPPNTEQDILTAAPFVVNSQGRVFGYSTDKDAFILHWWQVGKPLK